MTTTSYFEFEFEKDRDILYELLQSFGVPAKKISVEDLPTEEFDPSEKMSFYLSADLTDSQMNALMAFSGEPDDDGTTPEQADGDKPSDEPRA